MKKLLFAAVIATLAFTTIACGPPGTTASKATSADGGKTTKTEETKKG